MDKIVKKETKELKAMGKPLPNLVDLSDLNPLKKANNLKKARVNLQQLENKLNGLPMPKSGGTESEKKRIARERKKLKRQIDKAFSEVDEMAKSSKDIVFEDERSQMSNLAKVVGYKIKDFSNVDPLEFEKHKKGVLLKASNHFKDYSDMGVAGIIELCGMFEQMPYGDGTQKKMIMHYPRLKECLNRIFVDMAKKDINPTKYVNPYYSLLLAIGIPIAGNMLANYSGKKKKKKKKKKEKKKKQKKRKKKKKKIK